MKKQNPNLNSASEFVLNVKRENPLPDIPVDPKLLEFPFPPNRHFKEIPPLEANVKLHLSTCEMKSLISSTILQQAITKYTNSAEPEASGNTIQPKDKILLTQFIPAAKATSVPTQKSRQNVPWLRRTEYISSQGKLFGKSAEGIETKMGMSIMKDKQVRKMMDKSKQGQIQVIEQTFISCARANLTNLTHPTNPELKATEIFPIFPDFELWPNNYTLVTYDTDPMLMNEDMNNVEKQELHNVQLEEALLKPMQLPDDPDGLWFAYFAPTAESVTKIKAKRKRLYEDEEEEEEDIIEDEELDYRFVRDFDQKLVESNYPIFIELRKDEGGAFYNNINSKIILKKKRAVKNSMVSEWEEIEKPTRILLGKRAMNEKEQLAREETRELYGFE